MGSLMASLLYTNQFDPILHRNVPDLPSSLVEHYCGARKGDNHDRCTFDLALGTICVGRIYREDRARTNGEWRFLAI
jgi:hypothetical protein